MEEIKFNIKKEGYISIPESESEIKTASFLEQKDLNIIEIPNSIKTINDQAFGGCKNLTTIEIPNSVTHIGMSAFENCSNLNSIIIPNSVKEIGSRAFYNCENLNVIIDNSEDNINIGKDAFFKCKKLEYLRPSNESSFVEENETPLKFESLSNDSAIKLIRDESYENLDSIEIPQRVRTIKDRISYAVKEIGESAFRDCTRLTKIKIPQSVTDILNFAFRGCSGLTKIEIPSSVTNIQERAFAKCSNLKEIHCRIEDPKDINVIGNAFEDCELTECKLYVPIGTGYAYRHHPVFSQFKEVLIEI